MNVYCSIDNWIREHNPKFHELLASICLNNLFGKTFVNPSKGQVDEYVKMSKSKNKADRRTLVSKIRSHYINIDLHDKNFAPGKYPTINNNNTVDISAATAGVFTIKSGKDLKSVYKVKLNTTFEPEWIYRDNIDKNMCVVDFVSGEMSHEGITLTGIAQPNAKMDGASEYVKSNNLKMLNWSEVTESTYSEIRLNVPIVHAAVTCAGLLKFILLKNESVPEYTEIGKLIHTTMCYEPFAMWYILVQPFSQNQFMPERLIEEWGFAPCVHPDFCALWEEFANKYPTDVDHKECDALIADMKDSAGIFVIEDLQEMYKNNCVKLFSHIANFPCEQKLWADEVCYYICNKMAHIRKTGDLDEYKQLCETLKNNYPGKNYKGECLITTKDYWEKLASKNQINDMKTFASSFCCMKHCHSGTDELGKSCESTLRELSGRKPSTRLINTILLNREFTS